MKTNTDARVTPAPDHSRRTASAERRRSHSLGSLRFSVPQRCVFCDVEGMVVGETTISGGVAVLTWCCRACQRDWLVTPKDQLREQRLGERERRRESRVGQASSPSGR